MFAFQWPWMGLLIFLPLLVRYILPAVKRRHTLPTLRFPHLAILQNTFPSHQLQDKKTGRLFTILMALLWACLVLALMRPQLVDRLTQVENKGYDIMLAVDLSGSMRALDFSTQLQNINRLDVAKHVVGNFVKDRASDRIGLVVFGDSAYQYAPLTPDTKAVSQMLNETAISMAGDGTAIGDALGVAIKGLRDRPEKSKIIILLTDGEDTASSLPPEQAAQLAKQYGIRIYIIGIGSKGQVPYPDQYGRIIMVKTNIDEDLLRRMATETGGQYFHASNAQKLQEVYNSINQMEKSKFETQQYMTRKPLYRYPLGAALALMLLILTLPLATQRGRYGY